MNYSGVSKEPKLRLFNRNHGKFYSSFVHEGVKLDCPTGRLNGLTIHYSYADLGHHLEKSNQYTSLSALDLKQRGKRYSKLWVPFKFAVTFLIYYFLKRGILDGYPGFMWSIFAAFYSSVKIAKTIELQNQVK